MASIFIVSCNKDLTVGSPQTALVQETKLDVNKAKVWFEANQSTTLKCAPNWEEVKQLNLGNGTIEVPIAINGAYVLPSLSPSEGGKKGAMRLLIQADEKGDLNGCILQYLPTEKFSGVMEAVNWATAGQLKFDGLLLLKNLDDGFLGGISLKEGRVYSKKVSRSNVSNTHNGVSLRLQDECYPTYYWLCVSSATYGTTCRVEQGSDYCVQPSSSGDAGGVLGGVGGTAGSGSSGSSGGAPSGGPHSADVHCKSFSFRPTTSGSNPLYQGSTVQGIRMQVKDVDNHTRPYFITATYYIPTVSGEGHILTAKNATEIATDATNIAKEVTEDHFAGAFVTSIEFTNYFMNELRNQLALGQSGAFANAGASNNSLIVTKRAEQYYWDDFEYWTNCN